MKKLALIILLLLPISAFAHVTGGTVEKTEGNYFIDVGYSETTPAAGRPMRIDVGVYFNPNKAEVDYDSVYVKIMKGGNFIFTATLPKQTLGTAGMTYTFPNAGDYDITLMFQKAQTKIVETTFPLTLAKSNATDRTGFNYQNPAVVLPTGVMLGIVIEYAVTRFIKRKKS